ncbi:hypothetical protein PG984_015219 [Apiospora sp. TS-2023a]
MSNSESYRDTWPELGSPNSSNAPSTMETPSTVSQDDSSVYSDTSSARHTFSRPNTSHGHVISGRSSRYQTSEHASNPFVPREPPARSSRPGSDTAGRCQSIYSGNHPQGTMAVGLVRNGSGDSSRRRGSQATSGSVRILITPTGPRVTQGQYVLAVVVIVIIIVVYR